MGRYRIHIIGGPGSGKTTLARRLAAQLGAQAYNLDEIGYTGGNGPKRSLEDRLADVDRITARSSWVTEGIFLWWADSLFQSADLVIWLDLPWPIALWRILTRHIKLSLSGRNKFPGTRRLLGFLFWAFSYYVSPTIHMPNSADDDGATNRAVTRAYLAQYMGKLFHCRTPADVAALVELVPLRSD